MSIVLQLYLYLTLQCTVRTVSQNKTGSVLTTEHWGAFLQPLLWWKGISILYIYIYIYTGCPRRNMPDFGRVFLMLKYTDITQNTYIESWTFTEIMAREKWGLLAVPNTATCRADTSRDNASVLESECSVHCACVTLCAVSHVTSPLGFLMYSACNPKDNYDMSASVFVVQFNVFMSLTS